MFQILMLSMEIQLCADVGSCEIINSLLMHTIYILTNCVLTIVRKRKKILLYRQRQKYLTKIVVFNFLAIRYKVYADIRQSSRVKRRQLTMRSSKATKFQ